MRRRPAVRLEDLTCDISPRASRHRRSSQERSDEELQSSPQVSSWDIRNDCNYDAAWIAKELVKNRREFRKYLTAVRKNMKILHNKSCILEDDLFLQVLKYIRAQVCILDYFSDNLS